MTPQEEARARASPGPRILIVRVGAMGDVLHALPAVAMLRERLPQAFLGWAIEPRWASLLRSEAAGAGDASSMPLVNVVHAAETRLWSKSPMSRAMVQSVLALRRELRSRRYAIAIDLQGSVRSAAIARLSGAAIIGSAHPREWPARLPYTKRMPTSASHVIGQAAEIVTGGLQMLLPESALEAVPEMAPFQRAASLPRDGAAEAWCEALLAGETAPVVVLAPTAGWGAKEWPAERYGAVAAELAARGYRVVVNGTASLPDEAADAVAGAAQRSLVGSAAGARVQKVGSTLPQLTALLRRTALLIAGDTGPLHLAAALGRPVVAIFGPTDPARNGPFGTAARILRDPASVTDHRRRAAPEAGLLRIEVQAVISAAMDLLRADPGRSR